MLSYTRGPEGLEKNYLEKKGCFGGQGSNNGSAWGEAAVEGWQTPLMARERKLDLMVEEVASVFMSEDNWDRIGTKEDSAAVD